MYKFEFKLSYLNDQEYCVWGAWVGVISLRRTSRYTLEYERDIYNGTGDEFDQYVLGKEDGISRLCGEPLPKGLCEAFNAWLKEKHNAWITEWRANPQKYGPFDLADEMAKEPTPAWPAALIDGQWVKAEHRDN